MDEPDYMVVNPLQIKLSICPDKNHRLYKPNNNKIRPNPDIEKKFNQRLNEIRDIALLLNNVKKSINNRTLIDI